MPPAIRLPTWLGRASLPAVVDIDIDLVRTLVHEQFPRWRDLPVEPVHRQGWDNRTFRLGSELSVRLPSAEGYVAGVAKEDRWLPVLAPWLPLPVPTVVATGRPGSGYPYPWSVRRWLPGDIIAGVVDRLRLAQDRGRFLARLRQLPTEHAPVGGLHSFFRGCHPSVYGDQVQRSLAALGADVDVAACRRIWADATVSAWPSAPAWFHGDVAEGNLLAVHGALSSVIDFGTCGVGDPACDLVIAWTYFSGEERVVFRDAVGLDDDTWARARGWALWKALVTLANPADPDPAQHEIVRQILRDPVTPRRSGAAAWSS
jgi:aminoglycoside phosphotransferase (APT) family kinase protein